MLGVRQKLILGFAALLAVQLGTGIGSLVLLNRSDGTVERLMHENYDSVVYGQTMVDDIALMDVVFEVADDAHAAPVQDERFEQARRDFDQALHNEAGNITVAGEDAAVQLLAASWQRYRAKAAELFGRAHDEAGSGRPTHVRADIAPSSLAVRMAAQRIITLNLDNIRTANAGIQARAVSSRRSMYLLLAVGVALAAALMWYARTLLNPLRTITASANEIERGNLDLVVSVPNRDEVGVLADAFNAMAGRLRETRRSDRLKVVRAERTTQLALDSLPDAVAILTTDGRVDIANHTAERLFGLRPGARVDAIGQPRLDELVRAVCASGTASHPQGFDSCIQIMDGQERFFLPHALPITDSGQGAIGVTLVLADITSLRRLDELKSNLVAVVSHELKTPLTGLRMATHLLLDERTGPLTATQTDLLLSARSDSDRLHAIIAGLLDISSISSGRALMELSATAPARLLEPAISACSAAYRDKGVELLLALPSDLPEVLADAVRFQHVAANLLGNALTYTPSGGQVRVSATDLGAQVEFRIADTGIGIPREHRARIFERFYRIPGQSVTGAGLGLAIASEIIQAHAGRLWLDDQTESGSTFCFTIPTVRTQPAPAPPPAPA
jgi:signal transduction histidine kinase